MHVLVTERHGDLQQTADALAPQRNMAVLSSVIVKHEAPARARLYAGGGPTLGDACAMLSAGRMTISSKSPKRAAGSTVPANVPAAKTPRHIPRIPPAEMPCPVCADPSRVRLTARADVERILSPMFATPSRRDRERSADVGETIRAAPKLCERNCLTSMLGYGFGASTTDPWCYVEGRVVEYPIEHGWLETATGGVVDPTPGSFETDRVVQYFKEHSWSARMLRGLLDNVEEFNLPLTASLPSCLQSCVVFRDVSLALHRHLNAMHVAATGQPNVAPDEEAEWLSFVLGPCWTIGPGANASPRDGRRA